MADADNSFASVPVNQFFKFSLGTHDERAAQVVFRPERVHTQEYGVVHGGILSALADTGGSRFRLLLGRLMTQGRVPSRISKVHHDEIPGRLLEDLGFRVVRVHVRYVATARAA